MRWLIDAQLPPALAQWLASRGHEATHVADHELARAADTVIWNHALELDAVIITKDEDFADRRVRTAFGPAIVWLRFPNMPRRHLLVRFEAVLPAIVSAIESGEALVEIV